MESWLGYKIKDELFPFLIKLYWILFGFLYFSPIPVVAKAVFMFLLITVSSLHWGTKGGLAATGWFVVVRLGYHFIVPVELSGLLGGLLVALLISYLVGLPAVIIRRQSEELARTNQQLKEQLAKGKKIHQHLLPVKLIKFNGVRMASIYWPAEEISADFYQIIELEDKIVFYLSDVTGHGLDGSFLNLFLRGTIESFIDSNYQAGEKLSPSEIIKFVHYKYEAESFPDDYFISLLLFVMNKATKQISYTNAGCHIQSLLVKKKQISQLDAGGPPITNAIDSGRYESVEQEFMLSTGRTLVMTTDGLIEEQATGERYGEVRLNQIVSSNHRLPPELLLNSIIEDLKKFTGRKKVNDDISLLALTNRVIVDSLSLTIPSKYEKIDQVKEKIAKFIVPYWDRIDYLLIGLQEIAINAIEHGNNENSEAKVRFEVLILKDSIVIEIEDEGPGFDWREKMDKEIDFTDLREDGRGLIITRKAFDKLGYNQTGNKAILYKQRK